MFPSQDMAKGPGNVFLREKRFVEGDPLKV